MIVQYEALPSGGSMHARRAAARARLADVCARCCCAALIGLALTGLAVGCTHATDPAAGKVLDSGAGATRAPEPDGTDLPGESPSASDTSSPSDPSSGTEPASTTQEAPSGTLQVAPATGSASFTELKPLAATAGKVRTTWLTGQPMIVKDVGGAHDLVGFALAPKFGAYVSTDDGATWAWLAASAGVQTPSGPPDVIAQGADGKIHLLEASGPAGGILYSRLRLQYDSAGHIMGFGGEVTALALPVTVNTNADVHVALIAGVDGSGAEVLVYGAYDYPSERVFGRIQLGKTRATVGTAPASPDDFVSLNEGAQATQVWTSQENVYASPHNCAFQLAQHAASKDLWLQLGPADTFDTSQGNTTPLTQIRLTPSGAHAWSTAVPTVVEKYSGAGVTPQALSMAVTPHYVWFLRFSGQQGLVIDRADAAGKVMRNAIRSPLSAAGSLGSFVLSVNPASEAQAWVAGWLSTDSVRGDSFSAFYWNGSAWTSFTQATPSKIKYDSGSNYGVGGSIAWNNGLALLFYDYLAQTSYLGAIRTK